MTDNNEESTFQEHYILFENPLTIGSNAVQLARNYSIIPGGNILPIASMIHPQANAMLQETSHEMSLIAFEKKKLLQQWKSALIGLKRRDEALASAQDALKAAEASTRYYAKKIKQCEGSSAFVGEQSVLLASKLTETTTKQRCHTTIILEQWHLKLGTPFLVVVIRDFDMEIEGVKRETLRAQEEHEGLVAIKARIENDRAFVEEQLAKTKVSGEVEVLVL